MHQLRVATLLGYEALATSLGLDGRAVLEQAGLTRKLMQDPENRVPAEAVAQVLAVSARETECENFGLLLAEHRPFAALGPVAMLLERLPDLREMARAAITYQKHFNDIVEISLEECGDGYFLRLSVVPGPWPPQFCDVVLATTHQVMKAASNGIWRPDGVYAVRAQPADLVPWRRLFVVPVKFDSEVNGFAVSREVMEARNPRADPVMAANARRLLDLVQLGPRAGGLADHVRRTIGQLLPDGQANIGQVGAQLGMSPRSLQRRLEAQGLRFDALLDDVRRQLAATYLAQSAQPVTSLAGLLGYASPSSFSRWFVRAFGMSPLAWREERRRLGGQSAVAGAASGKNGMRASNSPPSPSLKV